MPASGSKKEKKDKKDDRKPDPVKEARKNIKAKANQAGSFPISAHKYFGLGPVFSYCSTNACAVKCPHILGRPQSLLKPSCRGFTHCCKRLQICSQLKLLLSQNQKHMCAASVLRAENYKKAIESDVTEKMESLKRERAKLEVALETDQVPSLYHHEQQVRSS